MSGPKARPLLLLLAVAAVAAAAAAAASASAAPTDTLVHRVDALSPSPALPLERYLPILMRYKQPPSMRYNPIADGIRRVALLDETVLR